jgi:hypothetical protein
MGRDDPGSRNDARLRTIRESEMMDKGDGVMKIVGSSNWESTRQLAPKFEFGGSGEGNHATSS